MEKHLQYKRWRTGERNKYHHIVVMDLSLHCKGEGRECDRKRKSNNFSSLPKI